MMFIIIVLLKRNQTISNQTTNILLAIIIVIGLFYIGGSLLDLSRRNNMVFQEYDFPLNVDDSEDSGLSNSDLEKLGFLKDTDKEDNVFDSLSNDLLGECVGAECCSADMVFNSKKSICEPKPKGKNATESFVSIGGAPY